MSRRSLAAIVFLFWLAPFSAAVARKAVSNNPERLWQDYWAHGADLEPAKTFPFDACFRQAAKNHNVPLSLLLAVARGESDFDPKAKSDTNCHGVMQIRWPKTAKHLGITRKTDLYEPCTNIRAGAKYLRELLDRYDGDVHLALAAYNYGPGRITKTARSIPDGARWYSGYIYHHLRAVMKGAGKIITAKKRRYLPAGKIRVIVFNKPHRAASFLEYVQRKAPSVKLDLFKMGLGRYSVVMLYRNDSELKKGKKVLGKLGFKL